MEEVPEGWKSVNIVPFFIKGRLKELRANFDEREDSQTN